MSKFRLLFNSKQLPKYQEPHKQHHCALIKSKFSDKKKALDPAKIFGKIRGFSNVHKNKKNSIKGRKSFIFGPLLSPTFF